MGQDINSKYIPNEFVRNPLAREEITPTPIIGFKQYAGPAMRKI